MSINVNRFCPNCGSPADPGQRFCANCGSAIDVTTVSPQPTAMTPAPGLSGPDLAAFPTEQEAGTTQISGGGTPIVPPPPPGMYQSYPSYQSPQSTTISNNQVAQGQAPLAPYQPVPDFARPQKGATRRTGLRALIVILVLLIIAGGVGAYLIFGSKTGANTSNTSHGTGSSSGTATATSTPTATDTSVSTPTPGATVAANATTVSFSPALSFIYANVQVSIAKVEQAPSFPDDTSIYGSPGVLRLDIKEASQPIEGGYYNYSYNAFMLVKADGTTLQASGYQTSASISAGVSRTNWLDFETKGTLDVNKLILHVGAADTEAQMDIPLQSGANLDKYQPKTYTINKKAVSPYGYVDWTITNVTVSYSALGSQAKKGNVYVIVSSRLDNNTGNNAYDSVGGNMRLQSGDTKSASENNSLASSVPSGQTNVTGNTTFQMPQGSTSFTCTVLSDGSGTTDVSIQFQLQ